MAQAILNQILIQLKSLEIVELQQLNQAVQDHIASQIADEQVFHQALLTSGLVKQIKMSSLRKPTERRLVEIEGQPISEIILKERR